MNATQETPKAAARRLAVGALRDGFEPRALHEYTRADGTPAYWRIRMKRPGDGEKWIRPMFLNVNGFMLGEPEHPPEGRPLYRLLELLQAPTDAPVFITEGETCADALASLGLVATTSGAADSAGGADWSPLATRRALIWGDHDSPGERYAAEVARVLADHGARVDLIDTAALGLPAKGDCVDWLAMRPDACAADVMALPTRQPKGEARAAPEPLRRPIPAPEPYPLDELGPILSGAARALRRVIQAPDAICGASVLAAASLATQALADVCHHGRIHPLSVWLLSVAESGERKSAVDAEAMRAARDFEAELVHDFKDAEAAHQALSAEWQSRCEHAKAEAKKTQGKGLADALRDIGPAPPAPFTPRVIVADFTAEGIAKLLMAGRPSIGAFTDEAALVFGGHGMNKEAITRTAGTLCKLWDSGSLDRTRATDGAVKLYGRRMALHLMAQPVIAERALSDDVLSGQGFLARCLLAWPESTAGTRPYVGESLRDNPALIRFADRLGSLHRIPLPCAADDDQRLTPRPLLLTTGAAELWRQLHDTVERQMAPGARFATCKPWASKTPEQCLRIAGVLTLVENPDASEIGAATVERAAELALWHLNEAVRLSGTAELSIEVRDAEALRNWCHESGRTLVYSGDALRLGPQRIRERERFVQAMGELERAGWASKVEGGAELDGRRRKHVWHVLPESEGR